MYMHVHNTLVLESVISISKLLIYFESSFPESLELQYFSNNAW